MIVESHEDVAVPALPSQSAQGIIREVIIGLLCGPSDALGLSVLFDFLKICRTVVDVHSFQLHSMGLCEVGDAACQQEYHNEPYPKHLTANGSLFLLRLRLGRCFVAGHIAKSFENIVSTK